VKINKLLLATHNPGKIKEIRDKLDPLDIRLVTLADLKIGEDYEETEDTYEANAIGKAKFYYDLTKIPALADDSGLSVDALGGEPGVRSRTWPGYRATDEELFQMLLNKMQTVPRQKRSARFITVMALYDGKEIVTAEGCTDGWIAEEKITEIEPGFPYGALFYPDGYDEVYGNMSISTRTNISHRGKAIDKIIKKLMNYE